MLQPYVKQLAIYVLVHEDEFLLCLRGKATGKLVGLPVSLNQGLGSVGVGLHEYAGPVVLSLKVETVGEVVAVEGTGLDKESVALLVLVKPVRTKSLKFNAGTCVCDKYLPFNHHKQSPLSNRSLETRTAKTNIKEHSLVHSSRNRYLKKIILKKVGFSKEHKKCLE